MQSKTWFHVLQASVLAAAIGIPTYALSVNTAGGALWAKAAADRLADDGAEEGEKKADEKKDPDDVRNSISDLSTVREKKVVAKPQKKGLWEDLVDLPYYSPEVRAEKHLFHGQYAKAEAMYAELLAKEPGNVEYQAGLLESILNQGRQRDLRRVNDELVKLPEATRKSPRFVALEAEALLQRGKLEEARTLLGKTIEQGGKLTEKDVQLVRLHVMYGKVLEQEAQYAAAAGVYKQVSDLALRDIEGDPALQTLVTEAIHRESVITGKGRDLNRTVLAVLKRIREQNATYWPAYLAEARILLANHNAKNGGEAIGETLSLNPNVLEARFLAMSHAIATYNFEGARSQLAELRERSESAEVDAAEARLILKEREPEKAIPVLLKAIEKNPRLPEARGWLAAAYMLTNQREKGIEQLNAVTSSDKTAHPVVLQECGEVLRDARQFTDAERYYRQAAAKASWWSEPQAALGQLYMETGEYEKALTALDTAYSISPTNMRGVNQLRLLEIMGKFQTKTSKSVMKPGSDQPTFIVRYDKEDEILATMAVEYLESIRPEIWSYFKVTELSTPTIIEFFPSHEQFGVRTTGLPWIGTVGACTGNVIAMDVPRGGAKDLMGAFDWARVLRHEYTHTVTLAVTGNRIPHWLTEAAAVNQEQAPRDWKDANLLASNFRAGTLFKLSELTWGFIRPKRTNDRHLAYMQSAWVYQYLVETYGHDKMIEFLQCFRDGLTEPQAFVRTYGKPADEIDGHFKKWAQSQVESWGLPAEPLPKREELEAALKKDENDVAARYKLAWLLVASGRAQESQKHLEKVLEIEPDHAAAGELLGAIYNQLKQKDKAKQILAKVVEKDAKRPVALRTLGLIAMGERDFDAAEKWFVKLQEVRPLEATSYTNLAGIYLVRKDAKKAIAQLSVLQQHEQKDERIPRRLAELYRAEGQLPEAENSAYRALRINPYNAVNHQLMAQVLMERQQYDRAAEYWQRAADMQPRVSDFWAGLAEAHGAAGRAAEAASAAQKAVEIESGSPAKKWIK